MNFENLFNKKQETKIEIEQEELGYQKKRAEQREKVAQLRAERDAAKQQKAQEEENNRVLTEKEKYDRREVLRGESLEALHTSAKKLIGDVAIDAATFTSIYDLREIKNDMEDIERIKQSIAHEQTPEDIETKKVATVLEAIIMDGITKYGWLSESVSVHVPSEFDEIKGGVDTILEFREEDQESEYLALGIDATFRPVYSRFFEEKVTKLLKNLEEGYLTRVKYFQNDDETPVDRFYIPKIVLSISPEMMRDAAYVWKHRKETDQSRKDFAKHKIRNEIGEQIIAQCDLLSQYEEYLGYNENAQVYKQVIERFNAMAEREMPELKRLFTNASENPVSLQIQNFIEKRKNTQKMRA